MTLNPTEGKLTEANRYGMTKRCLLCGEFTANEVLHMPYQHDRKCPAYPGKMKAEELAAIIGMGRINPAALESLKAPAVTTGEWRSIDDAPKDGSWIFVIIDGEIAVAHWSEHASFDNLNLTPDGDSTPIAGWETDGEGFMVYPTFWASPHPLPQPPNSTTLSAPAPLSSEAVGKVREDI